MPAREPASQYDCLRTFSFFNAKLIRDDYLRYRMIKILSTKQIKELDAYTIQHEPVASIDLMERACNAFCSWFTEHFDPSKRIGIVCGTGNNGGDGLGIARMLVEWDYPVQVWVVKGAVTESLDFTINLSRLKGVVEVKHLSEGFNKDSFSDCDVLIDAIFGSGLSRPPDGIYADIIESMNKTDSIRVAVDIPSGLLADKQSSGSIVKADYTVSFQLPKLAFFFPSTYQYVGEWSTVDIGLSRKAVDLAATDCFVLTRKTIREIIKPVSKFDHKGNRGHALLIAGSYGKMGAAELAARGALRSGIGLLTVHIPKFGHTVIQTAVPEAMASIDGEEDCFATVPELSAYDSIGIGPGIGKDRRTVKALGEVLENFDRPVVLDADALNIIGENRELLHVIPEGSILTPHHKEFERISGPWRNDFERLEKQIQFSIIQKVVIIFKGAHSCITSPEGKVFFNTTGNPGMATGGMGDVLTGMVTSFLAAGYSPTGAAQVAVWLHGMAGDAVQKKKGLRGMIASDIIDHLPEVLNRSA